ncbi:MAG TPA: 2-oxoglutarate dehydrogenase complex dihydrolipoyllysine-residue succinyltransferase [Vicinamibacterales bacterium]|nr:2-oxoglutarate dehydrogenase complex dihydrolipoyllysine-residue succinyltransferase [Vicinamibacterales bacterium]
MATNIVVPELGESVVEARVAKWLKKAGEHVSAGEPLVELETEKIDLEVSADRPGVLTNIKHQEGADVKVGEVLAMLEEAAEGARAEVTSPAPGKAQESKSAPVAKSADKKATPTAKNVAKAHDVKLDSIESSGNRVTKQDVLNATGPAAQVAKPPAEAPRAPQPAQPPQPSRLSTGDRSERRERMSKRRATIARRLVEAQHSAAMLTTFNEVDMSAVMQLRERRKEAFAKKFGVGVGIASFFVKAAIGALKAFPPINAEIQGDEIVFKNYYDIGMAVGAEGGLVVPVIRDADRLGFAEIELAIRDFAKRAQDGTLTLEDLKGGTFTITNGGVFGSLMSTPILNPPQVGILGLHKIADRPVAVNGQMVIRPMMYLALSYDHRIVDGREAVQFLVKIKEYIEDPAWMLLES